MLGRGNQVRGIGCYAQPVLRKLRCTSVGDGASFTIDTAESDVGLSLGALSSGRMTLTFPKCKRASFLTANVHSNSTNEALIYDIRPVTAPDAAAGTVLLQNHNIAATPVEAVITTGYVVEIYMLLDEGSS
jgi:hypothetical protein